MHTWWVVYLLIFNQGVEVKRVEVGPTMYTTEAACNEGMPADVANWNNPQFGRGHHLHHLAKTGIDGNGNPVRVGITKKTQCVMFGP